MLTLTPTRRTPWHRVRRLARIALLRLLIWSEESWLAECDPDGALTTSQITATRLRLQELRVELMVEEAS
jgi:hypothetical protein